MSTETIPMHPYNRLFSEMRDRWVYGDTRHDPKPTRIRDRTSTQLAEKLGVRKQVLSCWATGTDNRRPHMTDLLNMCRLLNLEIRCNPDGLVLTKARGKAGNLGKREDDFVVLTTEDPDDLFLP